MRISQKIWWTLLAALVSFSAFGQSTFGLRGGVNIAEFNHSPFVYPAIFSLEEKSMTGLNVAAFMNVPMGTWSFQPELHFIQKGMQLEGIGNGIVAQEVTMIYRYNYLEVPLLLGYRIGNEKMGIRPFLGPSAGYALNGKFIGENVRITVEGEEPIEGKYKEDLKWDEEFEFNNTKDVRWDYGLVGGLSLEFPLGKHQLLLDARYTLDLNDRYKYAEDLKPKPEKVNHRSIALTAGFGF